MQVTINGEKRAFDESFTISELLEKLEMPNERIAVELNKEIVRKKDWETVSVRDEDKIEIVHFVGGG
jgi:thiamine biosynthesis protein ThiS